MNSGMTLILITLVAFAVTALLGFVMIPFLHKLKFGQTILDIGPAWHKKKQGTPTMGGGRDRGLDPLAFARGAGISWRPAG